MTGSHGGCGNLVENAEVGGCVSCAGCVRDFQNKFLYPYISTHKTPERHENIRLILKNTDTSDTLGTS